MKVKVKVPATSANLGPGFDVAGLAVTLYNTFTFELLDDGLEITGCPEQFCNAENMTYQAFVEGAKTCGLLFKGLRIECSGDVPYTRGSVLPQVLSRSDAIANVSHLALMVASLINGYDDGLKLGFKDRLHQPYRGPLIEGFDEIMTILENDERVLGAYLSGAGPTIMAVIDATDTKGVVRIKEELGDLLKDWQVEKLELDMRGYTCDYE